MSLALKNFLIKEERDVDELKGKLLGIDIMPFLYKYLFSYSNNGEVLKSPNGVITSHLKGFLSFIKNLKILKIFL